MILSKFFSSTDFPFLPWECSSLERRSTVYICPFCPARFPDLQNRESKQVKYACNISHGMQIPVQYAKSPRKCKLGIVGVVGDRHSCFATSGVTSVQENCVSSGGVKCPDVSCKGIIEPRHCGSINIRKEVLDRLEIAVCESSILASQKFYCPYKDCSAMMVDDGSEMITASECPNCRRLFCAQCKVAWHAEKDCREFQSLDIEDERGREEDEMLMELAEKKQWRRCPRCSFYVERRDGCLHISCRCGKEFCYRCGATYSPLHVCPSTYDQD
nr:E3 ubiquitin-protein ligase RNF144A-like [Ipomoea trifida]